MDYKTLRLEPRGAVLTATIDAPPMNLIGPALVRDLVSLIEMLDTGEPYKVVVFRSGDPDYFISHVDVNQVEAYRKEAARLTGEASLGLLFRRLSETKAVTIAQIEGRTRGGGSEFVMSCDLRFAARGAVFSQNEASFGLVPGSGAVQHLVRLLGRGRALEVLLSADDFDADVAERYGWVNRVFEPEALAPFVSTLADRIAGYPTAGLRAIKQRVDAISLATAAEFRRDSEMFGELVKKPEARERIEAALEAGYQTREAEMDWSRTFARPD